MPKLVQRISTLTPNGWALRGFTDMAYDGARASNLVPNFLATLDGGASTPKL